MNSVFGCGLWKSEIMDGPNLIDDTDDSVSFGVTVRVTLLHPDFHGCCYDGTGSHTLYYSKKGGKSRGETKGDCIKSATTDALKRACRYMGRLTGGYLYEGRTVPQMKQIFNWQHAFEYLDNDNSMIGDSFSLHETTYLNKVIGHVFPNTIVSSPSLPSSPSSPSLPSLLQNDIAHSDVTSSLAKPVLLNPYRSKKPLSSGTVINSSVNNTTTVTTLNTTVIKANPYGSKKASSNQSVKQHRQCLDTQPNDDTAYSAVSKHYDSKSSFQENKKRPNPYHSSNTISCTSQGLTTDIPFKKTKSNPYKSSVGSQEKC